jgi:hypothetical protein
MPDSLDQASEANDINVGTAIARKPAASTISDNRSRKKPDLWTAIGIKNH